MSRIAQLKVICLVAMVSTQGAAKQGCQVIHSKHGVTLYAACAKSMHGIDVRPPSWKFQFMTGVSDKLGALLLGGFWNVMKVTLSL